MQIFTTFKQLQQFIVVWLAQVLTFFGYSLISFALSLWIYQQTGSVIQAGLISAGGNLIIAFVSPIAGALIDRIQNHRLVMILSFLLTIVSFLPLGWLFIIDQLEIWHFYLAGVMRSLCIGFQWTAFISSMTILVPQQQVGRASGMVQLLFGIIGVLCPALSAYLLTSASIPLITIIDSACLLTAILLLLPLKFPPVNYTTPTTATSNFKQEITAIWSYLSNHPGLFTLLLCLTIANFIKGAVDTVFAPLLLSITSINTLGQLTSLGSIGMLTSSLIISVWGNFQRHIAIILSCLLLGGLFILCCGLNLPLPLLVASNFLFVLTIPAINSLTQVILQNKVDFHIQARILSLKVGIETALPAIAFLIAGGLVDYVFKPLMANDSWLAVKIGSIIGVGIRGSIDLLLITLGFFSLCCTILLYLYPRLRYLETELPDVINTINPTVAENSPITVL
jgi:MFS family permease